MGLIWLVGEWVGGWVGGWVVFVEGLVGQSQGQIHLLCCAFVSCVCVLGCGAWLAEAWGCCGWSRKTSKPACVRMPQQHSNFARCAVCGCVLCGLCVLYTQWLCVLCVLYRLASCACRVLQGAQRRQEQRISCTPSGSD